MNEEFWRWYMYGHWVCLTQWLGFIMVEYAYLGKGRVKHPLVWSGVITMLTMTLSVMRNHGFFTPMAVVYTLLFLFITVMLFGGTPGQKFTACLINGTMCLLVENSVRYVISWMLECELQQVIQRADCLIIMSFANLVVSTGVSFFVGKWRRYNALEPLQHPGRCITVYTFFTGIIYSAVFIAYFFQLFIRNKSNRQLQIRTMIIFMINRLFFCYINNFRIFGFFVLSIPCPSMDSECFFHLCRWISE